MVSLIRFVLSVHLESALLRRRGGVVLPRGADNTSVPARGVNGDGFVCCGVTKYFLVPGVPSHQSVRATLTTTRGTVRRALYLRRPHVVQHASAHHGARTPSPQVRALYLRRPHVVQHASAHHGARTPSPQVRAFYLKAATCPAFPADIENQVCIGKCVTPACV